MRNLGRGGGGGGGEGTWEEEEEEDSLVARNGNLRFIRTYSGGVMICSSKHVRAWEFSLSYCSY